MFAIFEEAKKLKTIALHKELVDACKLARNYMDRNIQEGALDDNEQKIWNKLSQAIARAEAI